VKASGLESWIRDKSDSKNSSHRVRDKVIRKVCNNGGEPTATLEHPPNIREFDMVSSHTVVSKSPLLQARLKAMEKEKGPQQPQALVFNVILPDNVYGHRDPFPPLAPAVQAPFPSTGLIPGTHCEGHKMDIARFLSSLCTSRGGPSAFSGTCYFGDTCFFSHQFG
jgi:hypothetical protein